MGKMNKHSIERDIQIAIGMLEMSITDRYGNGRLTHQQRNFITATVTELLGKLLIEIDKESILIIPKNEQFKQSA